MKIKFYLKLLGIAAIILHSNVAMAQITGVITNSVSGEKLIGANVSVKGTTTGGFSDVDGNYSINAPSSGATLVFSFIGFISQEVTIGNQKIIIVELEEDLSTLDEIVVIAYGTVRKSDITGAVSSLKEKDFNKGINNSIDQLITGRAAGVQVSQTSSEPGGGVSIRIRGANSITAGSEPLYVIDGFPIDNSNLIQGGGGAATGSTVVGRNPLSSLNPSDIASVEILKDASATAIYGARGSNGVVLITTKTGGAGKTKVSYDSYYGHQEAPRRLETLNTAEYIQVMNEIGSEELGREVFSAADIAAIGEGIDWQSQVFRSAPIVNQNLSFSGGSEKTTFFTSFNYFGQQGVVKETGMKRFGGRLNLSN